MAGEGIPHERHVQITNFSIRSEIQKPAQGHFVGTRFEDLKSLGDIFLVRQFVVVAGGQLQAGQYELQDIRVGEQGTEIGDW